MMTSTNNKRNSPRFFDTSASSNHNTSTQQAKPHITSLIKQIKKRQNLLKLPSSEVSFLKKLVYNILKSTSLMCCSLAGLMTGYSPKNQDLKSEINK
jgi:hypothetical protein